MGILSNSAGSTSRAWAKRPTMARSHLTRAVRGLLGRPRSDQGRDVERRNCDAHGLDGPGSCPIGVPRGTRPWVEKCSDDGFGATRRDSLSILPTALGTNGPLPTRDMGA